jgi:hypothetical protein
LELPIPTLFENFIRRDFNKRNFIYINVQLMNERQIYESENQRRTAIKKSKTAFKLIKNGNWQPPHKPKSGYRQRLTADCLINNSFY